MLTQSSVPQGGTITPGAPVTAVLAPDEIITLFMTDPGGVVYTASSNPSYASGDPAQGWGPRSSVPAQPGVSATPGAPVTAVLALDGTYTLFMADRFGSVFSASGNPVLGWGDGWVGVSAQPGPTTPGVPVTAVPSPDGFVPDGAITLFMADSGGVVWTTSGNPAQGWGDDGWTSVSPQTGTTTAGAPVTAMLGTDGTYTLFMANTGGEVLTASGNAAQGWGDGWTTVAQGSTAGGAPVTAVPGTDGTYTVFLADPGGSVFTASGNAAQGWGDGWTPVSPQTGSTTGGAPVTAVPGTDGTYTLFMADRGGVVLTASGNAAQGWGDGWTPVSPQTGTTTAGAPVTAVLGTDGTYTLFMADRGGVVFTASGDPVQGWGPWFSAPQGGTTPGAPVTAVLGTDGIITLFLADPGGGVYTTWGNRAEGWGPWSSVSQGSTAPGAPVTAALGTDGTYTLFMADPGGGVYTASGNRGEGYGPWTAVSPQTGITTPGAPVTAVPGTDGTYTLFMVDLGGLVVTASGNAHDWGAGWTTVSPQPGGSTTPGATVTAVPGTDGTYTLFMANTGGEVLTASGNAHDWGAGWTPVSPQPVSATPGAPVTAVPAPDGTYTLFMADTGGEVFTASGNARGWGAGWTTVSQGSTTGGAPVTAVLGTDGVITVFLADPGGGVYTAWGNRTDGYGDWTTVSQGSTTPGAPVTAVLGTDGVITVFLADPGGGVYTAWGNRTQGYGEWTTASQGSTGPGAPVTAVLGSDGVITLFLADRGGGVYTASGNLCTPSGNPAPGWGPWSSVAQGSTAPGAPVTAVPGPDGTYTLFLADPGGGVYTASGNPARGWGDGWTPVSPQTRTTTPGATVTAVPGTDGTYTLFMADRGGEVFTASGNAARGWGDGWTTVAQGSTTPGAPVTAVPGPDGTYTLFLADPGGGVYTASGNPAQGWGDGWTTVAQGSTTPGAPVTAVPGPDGTYTVFLANPRGGVYTASGTAQHWGDGWTAVSPQTGSTTPGAPVTAVPGTDGTYTLFMADPGGSVYTAWGNAATDWEDGWTPVALQTPQPGPSTTPAAPVTAVLGADGVITLFPPIPGEFLLNWDLASIS